MYLALCIPARNESSHIQDAVLKLARVASQVRSTEYGVRGGGDGSEWTGSDSPNGRGPMVRGEETGSADWKIIVAVNGSTDGTAERAREVRMSDAGPNVRVEVIECPVAGKGAAVKYAAVQALSPIVRGEWSECPRGMVRMSEGDRSESPVVGPIVRGGCSDQSDIGHRTSDLGDEMVFGFIDADLSADPDAIPDMAKRIMDGQADIVIASRLVQSRTTNRSWLRTASSKFFNLAARTLLGIRVKDAQCGLKLMNSKGMETLLDCREDGWFLDIEFLHLAAKRGLRIVEVAVPWTEFRYPDRKSQIRHLRDGLGAIAAMIRIRRQGVEGSESPKASDSPRVQEVR